MTHDTPRTLPPLFEAIRRHDDSKLAAALAAGDDPNQRCLEIGCAVLRFAAMAGTPSLIATLIAAGADVDDRDANGVTPLFHAIGVASTFLPCVFEHALDNAQALLDGGADVNARNGWGLTPLHLAAKDGNVTAIRWLVERGADVSARMDDGRTPYHLAETSPERENPPKPTDAKASGKEHNPHLRPRAEVLALLRSLEQ